MPTRALALASFALALALPGCKKTDRDPAPTAEQARLAAGAARVNGDYLASGGDGRDWPATGFSYLAQRYSPLDLIDRGNVGRLGIAWYADLPDHLAHDATPVVVDGVIYIAAARSRVAAYDALTGKLIWDYDPRLAANVADPDGTRIANNGIALWKGKLFAATLDGRLAALDAKTGIPLWTTQATEPGQAITAAPLVAKNLVIVGTGGIASGADGAQARGAISAYDLANGTLRWRFYTTPNPRGETDDAASDPMLAVATGTWSQDGDWRSTGGGGAVADGIVYDPELDQLYFGTGPGDPADYARRSGGKGDNLFLSSIVAIKPDTGEYLWHFQETPGSKYGFGATDPIMLVDLEIDGGPRNILLHPSRNGFLFALSRDDGTLISAVPLAKDVAWAKGYSQGGRPIVATPAKSPAKSSAKPPEKPAAAKSGGKAKTVKAATPATVRPLTPEPDLGWRDGAAASFDPRAGLIFVPVQRPRPIAAPSGDDKNADAAPASRYGSGGLLALFPRTGKVAWSTRRALGGGTLATAGGLVFQGGRDGDFVAYDSTSGKRLWSSALQGQITGAPATFRVGGRQVIAVMSGPTPIEPPADVSADRDAKKSPADDIEIAPSAPRGAQMSRLIVFTLDARRNLPAPPDPTPALDAALLPGSPRGNEHE